MQDKPEKRIAVDIDTLLAIVGAVVGLQLTLWLAVATANRYYPIFTFLSVLGCLAYLALKKRSALLNTFDTSTTDARMRPVHLLLVISFFVLMSYALASVALRPDQYSRPLGHFVSMGLASAVLAVEITLIPPKKGYACFVLAQIVFLVVGLIWSTMVVFPGLLGFDAFSHGPFTEAILQNGHIPAGEYYSTYPSMHLTVGSAMLVTGLEYKTACMLSACLMFVIVPLSFVFLLGRFLHGGKAGLLAALLLGCVAPYLRWGWGMAPNGYAFVFLVPSIYLTMKSESRCPVRLLVLSMLLMTVLILTHTMAALCLAMFLLLAVLGLAFYRRIYQEGFKTAITLSLFVLFSVAMVAWWMQGTAKPFETLRELFSRDFSSEMWTQPLSQSVQYMREIPFGEYILRVIVDPIFWSLSFVGCLVFFSKRFGGRYGFVLAVGGLVVLGIGIFSEPLGIGVLPDRWQFASLVLLAIPAGIGLLAIVGALKGSTARALLMGAFVGALVFVSIASPLANTDRSITTKNSTVRHAFKESERIAATTIADARWNNVASDAYYLMLLPSPSGMLRRNLNTSFVTSDFGNREDRVVVIRQEVVEEPFYLPNVYKLDYDPREVLRQQGFSRVYDCGTVEAFVYLAR